MNARCHAHFSGHVVIVAGNVVVLFVVAPIKGDMAWLVVNNTIELNMYLQLPLLEAARKFIKKWAMSMRAFFAYFLCQRLLCW